jgi:hypothetical protein
MTENYKLIILISMHVTVKKNNSNFAMKSKMKDKRRQSSASLSFNGSYPSQPATIPAGWFSACLS